MSKAKEIVTGYMNDVWVNKNIKAVSKYIHPEKFIQHNPKLDSGIKALEDFLPHLFNDLFPDAEWQVKRIIAENDLVVVHSLVTTPDNKATAAVDIFRVEDDKITEHWDVAQEVPATTKSGNTVV